MGKHHDSLSVHGLGGCVLDERGPALVPICDGDVLTCAMERLVADIKA